MGLIPIDQVVTAQGKVVARSRRRSWCSRSRRRSSARSTCARARRSRPARSWRSSTRPSPPPISGALAARWRALQAEVSRLQAEAEGQAVHLYRARPGAGAAGGDLRPAPGRVQLQARDLSRRRSAACRRRLQRSIADACGLSAAPVGRWRRWRQMRKELERLQVGSQLNTLAATDTRARDRARPGQRRRRRRRARGATSHAMTRRARRLRCRTGAPRSRQKLSEQTRSSATRGSC